MIETLLFVAGGLVALLAGGEILVRGAVGLAARAGISPLVIGLVIVGFGTSMPELVTSVEAAMAGSPAIAWANVVGSNIANSLLILGAAALFAPIAVARGAAMRDTGFAMLASLAFAGLAISGAGSVVIGALLLAALGVYIAYCYREERQAAPEVVHNAPQDRSIALELSDRALHDDSGGWGKPVGLLIGGLVLLVVGGQFLIEGAIDLARLFGASETLIGLTVVAIGTSMPELVTSVVAARKGEAEVAFGNVVGSNIYNVLGIGGVTMIVAPGAIPATLLPLDIGVMTAAALAIFVLAVAMQRIGRLAGGVLFALYFGVTAAFVMQG